MFQTVGTKVNSNGCLRAAPLKRTWKWIIAIHKRLDDLDQRLEFIIMREKKSLVSTALVVGPIKVSPNRISSPKSTWTTHRRHRSCTTNHRWLLLLGGINTWSNTHGRTHLSRCSLRKSFITLQFDRKEVCVRFYVENTSRIAQICCNVKVQKLSK